MSRAKRGVYAPPKCKVTFGGTVFSVFPVTAVIHELTKYAGGAIGSAVISYPARYAADATPEMGKSAMLTIGGVVVFKGVIGCGQYAINVESDEVRLVLYDDKWPMQRKVVGQIGIGTQPTTPPADVGKYGFDEVGFEIVFNRDGKPNLKDVATETFHYGDGAIYWTLRRILKWLFLHYVDSTVAQIDTTLLSTNYDRMPSNLDLTGQTALQAIDTVVQMAGESWGLVPGASNSTFVAVKAGAGTVRKVFLAVPKAGASAASANEYFPSACEVASSIEDCHDRYQAISGRIVKERTISNKTIGAVDPLLVKSATFTPAVFDDGKYVVRYEVDRTKYSANGLGENMLATAMPKPWAKQLVTRLKPDGSDYLTAAIIAATPDMLIKAQPIGQPFVWLAEDGVLANAKLVTGGMKIDHEKCTIDFRDMVDLMDDDGDTSTQTWITDWSTVGIWVTVATILEMPQYYESTDAGYLPSLFYAVIQKNDLIPERRQLSMMPDLASDNNNAVVTLGGDAEDEELYVDVDARLQDAVALAISSTPAIETPVNLTFDFIPTFNIGDWVQIQGRKTGASGNEVVTEISYNIYERYSMSVKATNVVGSVNAEKFIGGR